MKKHLFIITSAINTKFGSYDPDQRLLQTFDTFNTIRERVPDAKIIIVESSGYKLEQEKLDILSSKTHGVINMSGDPAIQRYYNGTDNWDIVKNMCEIMCFGSALQVIEDNTNFLKECDVVHKLSGRYVLTDDFNLENYEKYPDKIIYHEKMQSQFDPAFVGIPYQYPSMLYSWAISQHNVIKDFYKKATTELSTRLSQGKYADIEHLMWSIIPEECVQEVPKIGVMGRLGQNRVQVFR